MKGMRPLTDNEAQTVQATLNPRDSALFVLGIRTGFRISELLSLRIRDIVAPGGGVAGRVEVKRKSMKGKDSGRSVVLHVQAREALASWLSVMARDGFTNDSPLFPSRKGSGSISRNHAWAILTQAYASLGFEGRLGTHSMRKTFACRVYDALGHDLVKTQRALGHKAITSTASYLSFREEDVEAAILA